MAKHRSKNFDSWKRKLQQQDVVSKRDKNMDTEEAAKAWQRRHPPGQSRKIDPDSPEGRAIAAKYSTP